MKPSFKPFIVNMGLAICAALGSCNKSAELSSTANTRSGTLATSTSVAATQAIAVSVSTNVTGTTASSGTSTDSVYVVNTCTPRQHRDSISQSSLLSAITTYLTTNYSGYTFQKAFSVKDSSGTVQGYIVIIQFNGSPVGLKFDASGNFVSVLEQREGRDLTGKGYHEGGCFQNRDGILRDTLSLSSLPATIISYFASNYGTDTLVAAYLTKDSNYVVISKDAGLYATQFTYTGTYTSRTLLPARPGKGVVVDQSALPSAILSYLTTTYPAYVFDKAFSFSSNGAIIGYTVIIDANSTRYAIGFDASGNFLKVKTIH